MGIFWSIETARYGGGLPTTLDAVSLCPRFFFTPARRDNAADGLGPLAHKGSSSPAFSATMYLAYQLGQSGSALPMRFSCSPWAASARCMALASSWVELNEMTLVLLMATLPSFVPGSRSC